MYFNISRVEGFTLAKVLKNIFAICRNYGKILRIPKKEAKIFASDIGVETHFKVTS